MKENSFSRVNVRLLVDNLDAEQTSCDGYLLTHEKDPKWDAPNMRRSGL